MPLHHNLTSLYGGTGTLAMYGNGTRHTNTVVGIRSSKSSEIVAMLREAIEYLAAGSYTRTDEKDWQAHAERAERALAEMTVHRDQCRDTAIKWQMEANRAVQPRALAPDAITDEMVERARNAPTFDGRLSPTPRLAREMLTAALTEPTRPVTLESIVDEALTEYTGGYLNGDEVGPYVASKYATTRTRSN